MILTLPKLAEALDAAGRQFIADFKDKPAGNPLASGFLMMSYILQAMDLKTREESMNTAMNRLIEPRPPLDLLVERDRNTLNAILKGMFGPLGVETLIIVGVTGEGRTYITHFTDKEDDKNGTVAQVKELMQAIIDDPDAEEFNL
jgi:hypothetical protein